MSFIIFVLRVPCASRGHAGTGIALRTGIAVTVPGHNDRAVESSGQTRRRADAKTCDSSEYSSSGEGPPNPCGRPYQGRSCGVPCEFRIRTSRIGRHGMRLCRVLPFHALFPCVAEPGFCHCPRVRGDTHT